MRLPARSPWSCAAVALRSASWAMLAVSSCVASPPTGFAGDDGGGGAVSGSSGGDDATASDGRGSAADGYAGSSSSGSSSSGTSSGSTSSGGRPSSSTSSSSGGSSSSGIADAATHATSSSGGDAGDPYAAARQECVDRINMHRATLHLAPLSLAPAATEACSDRGAMQDATSGGAHGSAGMCPGTGGQNTCPSLPVYAGATLISSLDTCLDQMWAEGPPPSGTSVTQCIQDYTGCFLQHGHWINMSDSYMVHTAVSCGFYEISSSSYWGNQDFMP